MFNADKGNSAVMVWLIDQPIIVLANKSMVIARHSQPSFVGMKVI